MKAAKKKFTIVGNWKMNPGTLEEAKGLLSIMEKIAKKAPRVSVIVCPPAVFIEALSRGREKAVGFGAQDVDRRERGPFTGAISASQVKSAGAEYTIIGHSERRADGDVDAVVAEKVKWAFDAGLRVILCVGEKERDNHAHYLRTVREQVLSAISLVDKKDLRSLIIAYEPVWAIGKSYDTALSPVDIHEMCIYIKKIVAEAAGKTEGLRTPVLYGGSINFENAQGILSDGEVSGLLIGRQSLEAEGFGNIINYANGI
ncbi:MAG: triose-phosphate isomerase [Candidatus Paceibacterota bacterium]|jgi:triosephosphate isomerase